MHPRTCACIYIYREREIDRERERERELRKIKNQVESKVSQHQTSAVTYMVVILTESLLGGILPVSWF